MSGDEDWYTPVPEIQSLVDKLRTTALSRVTHDVEWRKTQLRGIISMVEDNFSDILKAMQEDLGQNEFFAYVGDANNAVAEARFALEHLDNWMAVQHVKTPFPVNLTQPVRSEVHADPRGLCLVISPWNFPFSLPLMPMVAVIAAGNACILKPSEISIRSSQLLGKLIEKYLDPDAIAVVQGAAPQATELLKHRYDAICYTGNGTVGRIVAQAAAKNLTPTLLELGGKSPAIVCDDADLKSTAKRIAFGKFAFNMGQCCVAPDYVVVVEELKEPFLQALQQVLKDFFGADPRQSSDVGRIVSSRHVTRLSKLLDGTVQILHGGKYDVDARYFEPTLVSATADSTIMQEEIFGPILPILSVKDVSEATEFVNTFHATKGCHPLALYVFAKGRKNQDLVLSQTQSGGATVNDTIKHAGSPTLPFGGVGESGMGAYKGKNGFDFFSHHRSVLRLDNHVSSPKDPGNWLSFPPYSPAKVAWLKRISKLPEAWKRTKPVLLLTMPCALAYLVHQNPDVITFIREFNVNVIIDGVRGWINV